MERRKEVFQSKVLQKLYPTPPKQETENSPSHIVETLAHKPLVNKRASQDTSVSDGVFMAQSAAHPNRRMYTVLPPPADYKAGAEGSVTLPQPNSINTAEDPADESTQQSSEEPDQEGEKEEQRRRRRRKKRKLTPHEHSVQDAEAQASESSTGQSETHTGEGVERLSRNKRRKLKKKRHKEKLLSMGLVPRAAALEFTYQRAGDEEEEDKRRAAEVSDLIRNTMEIYMSDRSLHEDNIPVMSAAVDNLLNSLACGHVPTSVLRQLHSLKVFLQQKQPDKLAKALEKLLNSSSMSSEESTAVASLFQYWITDILPMQEDMRTEPSPAQTQDCQPD